MSIPVLLPMPRQFTAAVGSFMFPVDGVSLDGALCLPAAVRDLLMESVLLAGGRVVRGGASAVTVEIDAKEAPEYYRLVVSCQSIAIVAGSTAGAQHAVVTLRQIARQTETLGQIPCCEIVDWPGISRRGVMLDVSRDKMPTLASLMSFVDLLVELKYNEFQLYMEHTFAYTKHEVVSRYASALSGEEVRALDAYCRARHVDLVPNQNSFGHLTAWLMLPEYKPLAEAPDGCALPWGYSDMPTCLNPTDPRSIALVAEMFDEILPNFSSSYFNVGCDETHDVGQGRSKEVVEQQGFAKVYFDFLLKVHEQVVRHGRRMVFWGDMLYQHPEFVEKFPRDVIGLIWGYDSTFDFSDKCAAYQASGLDFYVCPGTGNWSSFCGRTETMSINIRNAVNSALKYGAMGFLLTDWGDCGHHQPTPVSFVPWAYGAALSWNEATNDTETILRGTSLHVFHDRAGLAAKAFWDLGNVYRLTTCAGDASPLFFAAIFRMKNWMDQLTEEMLVNMQASLDELAQRADQFDLHSGDAALLAREYALAVEITAWAASVVRTRLATPDGMLPEGWDLRPDGSAWTEALIGEYTEVWLARNRPGGLNYSRDRIREAARTDK